MSNLETLKQELFVIRQLAHKDKFRENSSSFLGQFWQILNPFINMIVLILVFSSIFANKKFVNYPMYIATGTVFFDLFNFGTRMSLTALVSNKNFMIKTQIDNRIYVIERIYVALINFAYSSLIYLGLMIYFKMSFYWTLIFVIPDLILFVFFVYSMGRILAVINALFADITYFYQIFTLFVFYGSAIFYSASRVSANSRFILTLNPVYCAISIARLSIMDGKIPPVGLWLKLLLYTILAYLISEKIWKKGVKNIVAKI